MPISKDQLALADKVHRDLFQKFIWTSDEEIHKVPEYWDRIMPDRKGLYRDDCDSFAIEMDFRLKEIGIAQEDRRIGCCSIEHADIDHCVLILIAEDGLYVSECNSPKIVKLDTLPYTMWYWCDPSGDIRKDWLKVHD